jgi:site-specific DNA-methyltransferase (adenine-specific)/adenine-specific DNA-methyltransferase
MIHELHRQAFTALKQPSDEMAVNDTVEAVGFDFIRTPELKYKTGTEKAKGEFSEVGFIKIETFKSEAAVREPFKKKGTLETLSMVMLDLDYNDAGKVFDLDAVYYAEALEKVGWKVRFQTDQLGKKMMAVFLDIYGNEARVLIDAAKFGEIKPKKKSRSKK